MDKVIENCRIVISAIKDGIDEPGREGDKCLGYANAQRETFIVCQVCELYAVQEDD